MGGGAEVRAGEAEMPRARCQKEDLASMSAKSEPAMEVNRALKSAWVCGAGGVGGDVLYGVGYELRA